MLYDTAWQQKILSYDDRTMTLDAVEMQQPSVYFMWCNVSHKLQREKLQTMVDAPKHLDNTTIPILITKEERKRNTEKEHCR